MERSTPVWEAPTDIVELMGDVSGNELNGWGEPDVRPPTLVMWANPARLAHGRVQQRITDEFVARPDLRAVLRLDDRHDPAPLGAKPAPSSPAAWVEELRAFAASPEGHEADLFGVARIRSDWFFEGRSSPRTWVVVLGVAMDHEALATAPEPTSAIEVHRQYNRGTAAARAVADWIRGRGSEAEGHGGPGAGPVQMVPAAIEAGFGELGKHGSIINRKLGSSLRLAVVLTDAPLTPTPADSFGVDDFCAGCRVCTDACPPDAIAPDKRLVRGVTKWAVDFDRCLPYFALSYGCGICIAVCPWSTPGASPRLAANMERKQRRRLGSSRGPNVHSGSRSPDRSDPT
jgi:ferredoxin